MAGVDRSQDLIRAAERFLASNSLPPEQVHKLREAMLLGRGSEARTPSSFAVAARGVEDSIATLWQSIGTMQREYAAPGAMSAPDPAKDVSEAEVAAFVKRIGGYIDRLKQAAQAAQAARQGQGQGAQLSAQAAAHMHGVVLILAERLHRAASCFDRLRAARYQALVAHQLPARPVPAVSAGGAPGGRTRSSTDSARGAPGGSSWTHILGLQRAGIKGHEQDGGAGRGRAGTGGGAEQQAAREQVQAVEQENRALLERLTATRNAAVGIEGAVRDVAALNQMFSSAVLAQAETIEEIYLAALDATQYLTAGNVSLTKTVAVNKSTTRYILVLLLVATLGLLLFDWMNS